MELHPSSLGVVVIFYAFLAYYFNFSLTSQTFSSLWKQTSSKFYVTPTMHIRTINTPTTNALNKIKFMTIIKLGTCYDLYCINCICWLKYSEFFQFKKKTRSIFISNYK